MKEEHKTAKEAETLFNAGKLVESRKISSAFSFTREWHPVKHFEIGQFHEFGWEFRLAPSDKPAVESVEDALQRHQTALALASGHDYYQEGFLNCAEWILSLSPAALEELRRGK